MAHTDTITTDTAYSIDLDWQNADADTADMLPRLVSYKSVTLLTIPRFHGSAPTYQYRSHDPETGAWHPAYYHSTGPTLAEWYAEQDYADERETMRDLRQGSVQ